MRYASAKSFEMKEPSNNNLSTQTGDVIDNPENPVNPDSKPDAIGWISKYRPVGEKTRGRREASRLYNDDVLYNQCNPLILIIRDSKIIYRKHPQKQACT